MRRKKYVAFDPEGSDLYRTATPAGSGGHSRSCRDTQRKNRNNTVITTKYCRLASVHGCVRQTCERADIFFTPSHLHRLDPPSLSVGTDETQSCRQSWPGRCDKVVSSGLTTQTVGVKEAERSNMHAGQTAVVTNLLF